MREKNNNKKTPTSNTIDLKPLNGIFKGVVKDSYDDSRTGRLKVFIPILGKVDDPQAYRECYWTSPFAGSTDPTQIDDNVEQYESTQKSYGMWMVPPDINNQVLVAFGDSIGKYGYVVACLFPDKLNHMVPGMPAGSNYSDPSLAMPVAEKNAYDAQKTNNDARRPVHVDLAEAIVKQGLINDPIRGAGSSGARRESPSQVFGILTPGPRGNDLNKSPGDNFSHRTGGHQFVMDDNYDSRMIRLRTAQGNQLLLDDTTGVIYMINKKGTAWFELGTNGDVTIFSEGSINLRAKNNFNLRADKNVNIEAGQNVNIKAAGDNIAGRNVGIPGIGALGQQPLGTGGNIRFEAVGDTTIFSNLNTQITSSGGDIDLNAGGRAAITASSPQGLEFNASTGSIKLQSTTSTSMLAGAGVSITSASPTVVQSPQILLNSGGAAAGTATPAVTAPQIGTNNINDAAIDPASYDRESALSGSTGATSNGIRTGTVPRIETIVSVMPTAEPYAGHGQFDPVSDFGKVPFVDQNLIDSLPPGANNFSGVPNDVVTPQGFQAGLGYTDATGNILDAGNAAGQLGAYLDEILDVTPVYSPVNGELSQFKAATNQELLSIGNLNGYVSGLRSAIPVVRYPTTNANSQKIIGLGKELSEQSLQLQQFAITAQGQITDLNSAAVGNMRQEISTALSSATGEDQVAALLASKDISIIKDGPGTIFQDKAGNMLVDFSTGIGPIGSTLGVVADTNQAFNEVSGLISAPLSENQTIAVASFAKNIGTDAFAGSNVLDAINQSKYSEVPRLMSGWSIASTSPGSEPVFQQSLADRAAWEGSIFQTPDSVDINVSSGASSGELSFRQLSQLLDDRRQELYS